MKLFLVELRGSTPIHVKAKSKASALAWCKKWELQVTAIHDDTANVQ